MSDEEFCDPSGASNHWHKKNTNRRLIRPNTSLFHWKRTFSSDISGANQSNKKKQKLIKYVDLTDNEPKEFCDTSEDSNENCYKTNVNTILQARQKRTISSETPDTSQYNKLKPEISNCARLSDSEIHTSDDSDDTKSPTKNIFSTNDLSNINPIAQQSSSKNNEIEDHKNTQFINHLKSLVKYDTNDILLPPGMPPVIAGVPVKFPVTPYKSQISVMNAVIKGCKNRENCLLESPTGSGKTLALLCAALAWQTYFIKNVIAEAETIHTSPSHGTSSKSYSNNLGDKSKNNKVRIPKIFYGSRTHKQIKQLIGELKKTAYSDIPMTILNSREHSCIQPSQKGVTKTQQCNELLDPTKNRKCQFYGENYKSIATHGKLNNLGFETPWDIEDLVELGRRKRACPYFATRDLMLEANIIFCPYNYLIDPSIRDAMQIQIDGHVIIVDEAHNIEDICRNVGSYFLREDYLTEAIEDITLVFNYKQISAYKSLYAYLAVLLNLIKDQLLQTQNSQKNPNDEITTAFWTGEEIWILFETYKLTGDTYENFIQDCKTAIEDYNKLKDDIKIDQLTNEEQKNKKYNKKNMAINFTTKNLIDDLQTALKYISLPGYQMSYRCTISQSFHQDAKEKISENTWISGHGGKRLRTLKFLCMNSEVTFSEIAKKARCVILASGTLSPIVSFESELGIKFPHKLHANHVVTKDQVYVRAISHGPSGTILKATYQNIQTLPFKDDLGRLIKEVCESIPHGILCFFASYTAMRSNIERWQDTDLWEELNQCKRIFVEPRKHSELDDVMMEYREAVESTGALLLAVFRGKVAEGIDFSDNYARCVITIGIPFAVQTDPDVRLKREYNETNRSKGLLTGSEWYTVQAYRALNQALGRCIRHKNDWGAVLLVDESNIINRNSKLADPCCMILSNMTRPYAFVERIITLAEQTGFSWNSILNVLLSNNYNSTGAKLHYLGPVFSNLTQSKKIQSLLMNKDQLVLQRLLSFVGYEESTVRRGGIVGTLRNCCFDIQHHEILMDPDIDIISYLLLPLAGPEEFTDEENDKLPIDLQYLPETKKREEDPDIRIMLLEALGQLCATRNGREQLRKNNAYIILREFHKWEKHRAVLLACENVVDILIKTEEEIGLDNLKEVEVPQECIEKFYEMDKLFLKDEDKEGEIIDH